MTVVRPDHGRLVNQGPRGETVIRTPDQRLRVFVSSTLGELAEERRAVSRAISALRLSPVMFELGARPYPPREVYQQYLAQSDVFIGLYWQRYGQLVPGAQVSGLDEEFELSGALPRLLYVKTPAPDREPRLADLLDRIQAEASASYDAVVLLPSTGAAEVLATVPAVRDFVSDAVAHCKFIGYGEPATALFAAYGLADQVDDGFLRLDDGGSADDFLHRCGQLRFWDRELTFG